MIEINACIDHTDHVVNNDVEDRRRDALLLLANDLIVTAALIASFRTDAGFTESDLARFCNLR